MCLAVPGQIISVADESQADPESEPLLLRTGRVRFGSIVKEVNLGYVPEARVGDYVIVHVGFAISIVDEEEAARALEYARGLEDFAELDGPSG